MEISTKMQAYQFKSYQGPAAFATVATPQPAADELLVAVMAVGLNPVDYKIQAGKMKPLMKAKLPLTMGNEFSGTVVAIGKQVTGIAVGDRVYGRPDHQHAGTLAEYLTVPATQVAKIPEKLSFTEAAALPLTGLTSYQVLHDVAKLQPQERVLIQAGAGGIGVLAIQMAKRMGAFVATTASAENADFLRQLGADQVIDYRKTDFSQVLHDYDLVFDTLGGRALQDSFQILRPGGQVISISGVPTAALAESQQLGILKELMFAAASYPLQRRARAKQTKYQFLLMHPSGSQLKIISDWVTHDELHPVIAKVFPWEETGAAYDQLKAGHVRGKLIVQVQK